MELTQIDGNKFPDLHAAQMNALPALASNLAATIQRLLADGLLVNENGKIIPNPERKNKK